jgi:hypothetical protein
VILLELIPVMVIIWLPSGFTCCICASDSTRLNLNLEMRIGYKYRCGNRPSVR